METGILKLIYWLMRALFVRVNCAFGRHSHVIVINEHGKHGRGCKHCMAFRQYPLAKFTNKK